MIVTLLGATGRTGRRVVDRAVAADHTVTALVRNSNGLDGADKLLVLRGDVRAAEDIARASDGADVVISVLGERARNTTLMSDVVAAVISAATISGCNRFILLSTFFAAEAERLKTTARLALRVLKDMKDMIADKSRSETRLKESALDWTIVHATNLTDRPTGNGLRVIRETERVGLGNRVARVDVADWLLTEAAQNAYVRRTVLISR